MRLRYPYKWLHNDDAKCIGVLRRSPSHTCVSSLKVITESQYCQAWFCRSRIWTGNSGARSYAFIDVLCRTSFLSEDSCIQFLRMYLVMNQWALDREQTVRVQPSLAFSSVCWQNPLVLLNLEACAIFSKVM